MESHDIKNTNWLKLEPDDPYFFLVKKADKGWKTYKKFISIIDIFPVHSVGIVTARDKLTIQWTVDMVWENVRRFLSLEPELARDAYNLGKDARDWKVKLAQEDLKQSGPNQQKIVPILYRPFDVRYTYYTGKSRGFHCMPRGEVMKHMLTNNLGITFQRGSATDNFQLPLVSNRIIDQGFLYPGNNALSYLAPLYIYDDIQNNDTEIQGNDGKKAKASFMMLFDKPEHGYQVRKPNINWDKLPSCLSTLKPLKSSTTKENIQPEEAVFYYIYAVLYSNIYRKKYREFLKTDFPRIPFTNNQKLFKRLAEFGAQLVELHLLKSKLFDQPKSKFQGQGETRVNKPEYDQLTQCIYINKEQYFDEVELPIWEYQIGGYQVLDKWLKSRIERVLSLAEQSDFCKIITSLTQTIAFQQKIDKLYPKIEKTLV